MNKLRAFCFGLIGLLCAGPALAETVTVFAAASLAGTLDRIAAAAEAQTGHRLRLSYAGSSALARQIEAGAPADLVILANTDWMDRLEARGLLTPETRRDLAGNGLVLIAHDAVHEAGAVIDLTREDLAEVIAGGRLAMALVEAVPAGIYGKAALAHLGQWDGLAARVVQTDNVRTALSLVAQGHARYGIVYATDARAEPRVQVRAVFPTQSHEPIRYPVAVLAARDTEAARDVLDFLLSEAARALLVEDGFTLPDHTP